MRVIGARIKSINLIDHLVRLI